VPRAKETRAERSRREEGGRVRKPGGGEIAAPPLKVRRVIQTGGAKNRKRRSRQRAKGAG